jgi:prepilin peptidase CpaA
MQLMLLFVACILVAGWDLIARRVPNGLLIVIATLQCVLLVAGVAEVGWFQAFTGLVAGLVGLMPFYLSRMMGAGDVKFAAAIGLICGPWTLFVTWVLASVCAGIHAAVAMSINASPILSMVNDNWEHSRVAQYLHARRQGRRGIPYAAYLAGGLLYLRFLHPTPFL